ncbi:hypothetical protein IJ670_00545, partial [bacterium]|nr:hypothetical protein [bacterium]
AVIVADWFLKYVEQDKDSKFVEIPSYLFACLFLIAGIVAPIVFLCLKGDISALLLWASYPCFAILIGVCLVMFWALKNKKRAILFWCYVAFMALISAFCFHKFLRLDYQFGQFDLIDYAKLAKEKGFKINTFDMSRKYSLIYYSNKHVNFEVKREDLQEILEDSENMLILPKKSIPEIEKMGIKFLYIAKGTKYDAIFK